jgi:cytochrome c
MSAEHRRIATMTSLWLTEIGLALVLAAGSLAQAAAADVNTGKRLTEQWCDQCHVIGNGSRGTDAAPPLPVIAQQKGKDPQWVKTWLVAPHPPMPNLNLSRQEIDDITAYLTSLNQRP